MAPIVPFIPLISSGLGALGGMIGAKKDKSGKVLNVAEVAQQGLDTAGQQRQLGTDVSKLGMGSLTQASKYFGDILSGGQALAEATGTTASDVGRQYESVKGQIARNAPRGGAATRALAQLPYLQASDVLRLRQGARETAGQATGQLGLGATGLGVQSLGSALSGYEGLLGSALGNRAMNRQFYGDIGENIGTLLGDVLSKVIKPKGSSGGGGGGSQTAQGVWDVPVG